MAGHVRHTFRLLKGNSDLCTEFFYRSGIIEMDYVFRADGQPNIRVFWPRRVEDIKGFTLKHPKALIEIECRDDDDCVWKEFYQNGNVEVCKGRLVFKPFTKFGDEAEEEVQSEKAIMIAKDYLKSIGWHKLKIAASMQDHHLIAMYLYGEAKIWET